jgi:hypothetical protein
MARLTIESGEEPGREFKVAGAVVIGRLKTNPVPIEDAKASREHTAVRLVGADYYVADLESRNGTYLNGRLIRQQERLRNGDRIQIGRTVLLFSEDAEDQARRAELAAQAAAPPPVVVAAPVPPPPPPPRPEPRAQEAPPPPRPAAFSAVARARGPGPLERIVSFVVHAAVFAAVTFASYKLAGIGIKLFMGRG